MYNICMYVFICKVHDTFDTHVITLKMLDELWSENTGPRRIFLRQVKMLGGVETVVLVKATRRRNAVVMRASDLYIYKNE